MSHDTPGHDHRGQHADQHGGHADAPVDPGPVLSSERDSPGRFFVFLVCALLVAGGFTLFGLGVSEDQALLFVAGIAAVSGGFALGIHRPGR